MTRKFALAGETGGMGGGVNDGPDDTGAGVNDGSNGAEDGAGDGKKTPDPVPYARFKQLVDIKNEMSRQLTELQTQVKQLTDAKLEEEQNFKQLADDRKVEIDSKSKALTDTEALVAQYKSALASIVDDTAKDWPASVKAFDPGADADPLKRLEWMKNGAVLVGELSKKPGSTPGMSPKPLPAGNDGKQLELKSPIDVRGGL